MTTGRGTNAVGLPDRIQACLFDLDGVLTSTAAIHASAWKEMFDEFLRQRADTSGEPFVAFDIQRDYEEFVDGKPREDGVRSFLVSRHITLPEGAPDDGADIESVYGLGNRKNRLVQHILHTKGVTAYDGSRRYLEAVRAAGLATAVVSSSANTKEVLRVADMTSWFAAVVDGVDITQDHLAGKPAPDSFLLGAQRLGVEPAAAAVFEDALAGVEAGRAGRFGFVVGVDRVGHADALRAHGADVVVQDLADLLEPA